MKHLEHAPRKPLFERGSSEAETFMCLFDGLDDVNIKIAEYSFIDGLTAEELEEKVFYSKRQIERIRIDLLRLALKRAVWRIEFYEDHN